MPMGIISAKGRCNRCLSQGKNTEIHLGTLKLYVGDWAHVYSAGVVKVDDAGALLDHHHDAREVDLQDKIQDNHNNYTIFGPDDNILGEMSVSFASRSARFWIQDGELANRYVDEARELQRKHGFGAERFT